MKLTTDWVNRSLAAIESGDESAAIPLLKEFLIGMAGGSTAAPDDDGTAELDYGAGDEAGSEGDGAEGAPPEAKKPKQNRVEPGS